MWSLLNLIGVFCRLQDYQAGALKEYFEQDGLLVPIETIRGKSVSHQQR